MTRKPRVAHRDGDPTDGGRLCGANKRQGSGTCRREAGWGTDHPGAGQCKLHAGSTTNGRKNGQRLLALAEAEHELDKLGRRVAIDSIPEAMLALVEETAANVAVYRQLLQERTLEVGPEGIAQHTGSTSKPAEVERHVWLALYDDERDRLMRYMGDCTKLGIELARIQQAAEIRDDQVNRLEAVVRHLVDELRGALVAAGVKRSVIDATYRERLGPIVRAAIGATRPSSGAPPS